MVRAAATPCRAPGCGKACRGGYCDKHKHLASNWQRDGNTTERGYGHAWRKTRTRILQRDQYLCQLCLPRGVHVQAVTVDHIVPKARGGTDADDNLQALCDPCHKAKTAREHTPARGIA